MIEFSNIRTMPLVCNMWKQCFGDTDEFIELHFRCKYRHENTLVFFDDNKATASLQMFPYQITFWGRQIPFYYLAGLCTLPEYRQRGYMAQLIREAHLLMEARGIPLSILVPADAWLFRFYEKFEYEQVFDKNEQDISFTDILGEYPSIEEAYVHFNAHQSSKDFCVQKSFNDFEVIIEEAKMEDFPIKHNLSAMARIIDINFLVELYNAANLNCGRSISVDVIGEECLLNLSEEGKQPISVKVGIRLLCRLLFGFRTSELDESLSHFFPEHSPEINLMLE